MTIQVQLQECEELKKAIAMEIAGVITSLSEKNNYWKALVSKELSNCLSIALSSINSIAALACKEMDDEKNLRTEQDVLDINIIYGVLHLLGANATALIPGIQCTYSTSTTFSEAGIILSLCNGNILFIFINIHTNSN